MIKEWKKTFPIFPLSRKLSAYRKRMTFRYEFCALCLLHTEIVVLMAMLFLCFRIFFIFCLDFATVPCVNVVWDEVFRRMPLSSERYECNDYNLFVHKCTHTPSHTRNALVWATESSFIYRFSIYYSKRVADIRKNIILSILLKSRNDCIWERAKTERTRKVFHVNEIFRFMLLSHRHRMLYIYLLHLTKMYHRIKIVKMIGKVCISWGNIYPKQWTLWEFHSCVDTVPLNEIRNRKIRKLNWWNKVAHFVAEA